MINYAFVDSSFVQMLGFNNNSIELANPMSSNQDVMRPSLVPGLLNNFEYNFNRGAQKFKIFEVGNVFTKKKVGRVLLDCSILINLHLIGPVLFKVAFTISEKV